MIEMADSGTENCPVTYTSYPGEEVIFSGATELDIKGFEPVTDKAVLERVPQEARDKVMQFDLKEYGMAGLGRVGRVHYAVPQSAVSSIYWDGEVCNIARWPNDEYARVGALLYPGISSGTGNAYKPNNPDDVGIVFRTDAPRVGMWKDAKDAWLLGYWKYNWAMDSMKIKNISGNMVATEDSPSFGTIKGAWYYIYNLIEELDAPGEWYVDSDTDMLYIYPPTEISEESKAIISSLEEPIININGASHVRFERITIDGGLGHGIYVNECNYVEVAGCTVKNVSKNGMLFKRCYNSGARSCDVTGVGALGIEITEAGNRSKLENSCDYVINCHVWNFSAIEKVYTPAIRLGNIVGAYAGYNKIEDSPHMAMGFSLTNNCIMEYNEISDVLKEASDAGAIYTGQDYLGFGNVVRYNYIHDILGAGMLGQSAGIYFDDMQSGCTAYGNIINRANLGFLIGGGKYNNVQNNIVMNASEGAKYSLEFDGRGMPENARWETLRQTIKRNSLSYFNYKSDAFLSQYPMAERMAEDLYAHPVGGQFENNVVYKHKDVNIEEAVYKYSTVRNIFKTDIDIGFVDEENDDLRLRDDSIVYKELPEFKRIPFERIGLYEDEYRDKEGNLK